jgi:polysaccharide biosynthesis transport protein
MSTEFSTELASLMGDGPASSQGSGPRGLNIKRLIRLRLPIMILIGALIAVPGAVLVWTLAPVQYSASANVLYAVDTPGVLSESANNMNTHQLQRFLNDQVSIITGPDILSRAAAHPDVSRIEWLREADSATEALRNTLTVRLVPGTNIINITSITDTSAHAMQIVEAVRDEYMNYASAREQEVESVRLNALREEKDGLQNEFRRVSDDLLDLQRRIKAPMIDGPQGNETLMQSYHEQLTASYRDHSEATRELAMSESEYERLAAIQAQYRENPSAEIQYLGIENEVKSDTSVQILTNSVAEAKQELAVLLDTWQEGQGPVVAQQKKLAALEKELALTKNRVRGERIESRLSQLESTQETHRRMVAEADERREKFQELIDENEGEELELSQEWAEIRELQIQQEDYRESIKSIDGTISQIILNGKAPARVSREGMVEASNSPNYGLRLKLLAGVMFIAGCAALGWGLFRELTDQSVRTPQDVGYVSGLPLLASIPHTTEDRLPSGVDAPLLTAEHPNSTTADEFRRILTRIIYPSEGSAELNTVLIVSPSRGDGKTSMAANLAISLAQANRRVLLVDISARHPSVERVFGFEPDVGLGEILCGESAPNDAVRATQFHNLDVLGPGFRGRDLVGKLASRETVEFLERAEEAYEHVLIDTPPALFMSDAKLLAPIVDGVIVVCGVGVSTMGMLRRCISELQNIGANIIGICLNGIRPHRGGYLRKNLQLYYQYSEGRSEGAHAGGSPGPAAPDGGLNDGNGEPGEEDTPMIMLVEETDTEEAHESSEARR